VVKIHVDRIRGIGHVNQDNLTRLYFQADRLCDQWFGSSSANSDTCIAVTHELLRRIEKTEGVSDKPTSIAGRLTGAELGRLRAALKGRQLGVFFECALDCPEGFEKVVLRKMDRSINPRTGEVRDQGRCICRLDPAVRRKFTGKKYEEQKESDRTPFGSEKKPIHLRRKYRDYAPGLTPKDIRKLT